MFFKPFKSRGSLAQTTFTRLLGASLLSVSLCVTADVSDFYEDALVRFHEDDFRGAAIQLKNALLEDPNHLPSRILLGRAYLAVGDGGTAEKEFRVARLGGADPSVLIVPLGRSYLLQNKLAEVLSDIVPAGRDVAIDSEVHEIRGAAFLQLNKLEDAEAAFRTGAKLAPEAPWPLVGLAQVSLVQGKLDAAEMFADEAIARHDADPAVWNIKARIARANQDVPATLKYLNKTLELHPTHLLARLARAETLIGLQRDDEAKADVETVLSFFPEDPRPLYLQAVIALRQGDSDTAQDALTRASATMEELNLDQVTDNALGLLLSGLVAYTRGQHEKSFASLTRYLELDPGHLGARRLLGEILLRRGEPDKALEMLRPAALLAPDNGAIQALVGDAYLRTQQPERAVEALEAAVQHLPGSVNTRVKLGEARLAAGQHTEALSEFQLALSMDDGSAIASSRVSQIYMQTGRFDDALELAQRLIEDHPQVAAYRTLAGTARMGRREWELAKAEFEQAIVLDPTAITAYVNLAEISLREGNVEAAEARYLLALDTVPDAVIVMDKLATLAQRRGELDQAVDWLEKARAVAPDARAEIIHLTQLYLQRGEPKQAVDTVSALALKFPDDFSVLTMLGRAEHAAGKPGNARATFQRMARLAVYDAPTLYRVSQLQFSIEDFGSAIWSLQKVLQVEPSFLPAEVDIVRARIGLGDFPTAIEDANRIKRDYPERGAGDVLLGDILIQQNNPAAAAEAYAAALTIEPTSQVAMRLYQALSAAGEPQLAIQRLEDWMTTQPQDWAAYKMLAGGYLQVGRIADAQHAHEQLAEVLPNDAYLLNNLASIYAKMGDPRARSLAEQAYQLSPESAAILDTLGWILVQAGQHDQALPLLREAHARAATEPSVRYHLAVTLHALGRDNEALEELQAALDSNRSFDGDEDARSLLTELTPP